MQTQKGFTLIELLVVIAIIGILAGMVVVNMSSAPNAAKDATIKSYMDQVKSTAAIQYANNSPSTYTGLSTLADYNTLAAKISAANPNNSTLFTTSTDNLKYCVSAKLNAVTGSWCVDSAGNSNVVASTSSCNTAATAVCQ